jgi:hypothetical protein
LHIALSLHNHTIMSDGEMGIHDLLKLLSTKYQVIAITDHDALTIPHPLHLRGLRKKFLLLKGIEYSASGMVHLLGLEPTNTTGLPIEVWDSCRVKWISHPRLSDLSSSEIDKIIKNFPTINGLEIFNSGILQICDNTDEFTGMNFYASDDLHMPYQLRASWMEMDVDSLDKETIIQKLIDGSFTICTSNITRNQISLFNIQIP